MSFSFISKHSIPPATLWQYIIKLLPFGQKHGSRFSLLMFSLSANIGIIYNNKTNTDHSKLSNNHAEFASNILVYSPEEIPFTTCVEVSCFFWLVMIYFVSEDTLVNGDNCHKDDDDHGCLNKCHQRTLKSKIKIINKL